MAGEKLSTKDFLKILAVSGIILSSFVVPGLPIAFSYISRKWVKYKRGDIGKIIRRFHKQELISFSERIDGRVEIKLSEKGKNKLLTYDYESIELKKKRDGKFRMVLFDIPEELKVARELFRRKLRELGFVKVQKSVFISAYPCKKELEFVSHYLGINSHIILLELGKIEIGEDFIFKPF